MSRWMIYSKVLFVSWIILHFGKSRGQQHSWRLYSTSLLIHSLLQFHTTGGLRLPTLPLSFVHCGMKYQTKFVKRDTAEYDPWEQLLDKQENGWMVGRKSGVGSLYLWKFPLIFQVLESLTNRQYGQSHIPKYQPSCLSSCHFN